jgi:hypothetical protein
MVRKLSHFSPQSCLLTHSISLVLYKSLLKIATRKSQLSPNSMVSALCSVLIAEWDQLGNKGWTPLQSCRVRADLLFMSRGRPYLHVLLLCSNLWVEDSALSEHRADSTILVEILTMPGLRK